MVKQFAIFGRMKINYRISYVIVLCVICRMVLFKFAVKNYQLYNKQIIVLELYYGKKQPNPHYLLCSKL